MSTKRIMFWDIETSLSILSSFTLHNDYISPENILKDWHIICASWKYLGDKRVYSVSVLDNKNKDIDNDLYVVKALSDAIKDVDLLVAHNGDKFDVKKLNARLMYHNLDPLPAVLTLDTHKEIKKVACFTSHKLSYLGPHLGVGEKLKNTPGLWIKILGGDIKCIKEMIEYNKVDTVLLEKLYLRTRKYYKTPPNLAPDGELACTTCQSYNIQARGYNTTKSGLRYQRYKCNACSSWFQGRTSLGKSLAK